MAAYRELAAIRSRLGADATLVAMVPVARIYLAYMADVTDPVYPAITLSRDNGRRATWSPTIFEPLTISVQVYSQRDVQESADIYTRLSDLLHRQETALTNAQVRFWQCHEVFSNTGIFDEFTKSWQLTARYLVRFGLI